MTDQCWEADENPLSNRLSSPETIIPAHLARQLSYHDSEWSRLK